MRAVMPDIVGATMQRAPTASAVATAAMPTEDATSERSAARAVVVPSSRKYGSVASAMRAIVRTASTGCAPMAVSPESMTQSVPS